MSHDYCPARISIDFFESTKLPIRPLISELQLIKNKQHWGSAFRFGFLEISREDDELIASRMLSDASL